MSERGKGCTYCYGRIDGDDVGFFDEELARLVTNLTNL